MADERTDVASKSRKQAVRPRPVLLFDGVCNLCNGAVNFVIDHDPAGRFRFASLQSEEGRALLTRVGRPEDYRGSLVLVNAARTRAWVRSDAVLEVARHLGGPLPALARAAAWLPHWLRDAAYDVVARRRYRWFGQRTTCRVMTPELKARFFA